MLVGGALNLEGRVADECDTLVEARFFAREELAGLTLFPAILHGAFWTNLAAGFPRTRYLGLHRPEFA